MAIASAPDKNNINVNLSTQTVSQQTYTEHTVSYTSTADQVYYIGFGNTTPKVVTTTALRLDNISFSKSNLAVNDVNKTNIKVYPNPVVDQLNIKTDETIKSVQVYSLDGKLLKTINGNTTIVDFKNYPKGSYLVKIETNKSTTSQKVIK